MAGFGKGHWTRTLLFDRQREKLYVTVGSSSNIGKGDPPVRAAVNRINPDGSGHEIFATGLRNTVGLRWRPGTDELWGSVQERDGLGDDLPDDYLVHIKQGKFYGFPDAYSGPHKEPRHKETGPGEGRQQPLSGRPAGRPRVGPGTSSSTAAASSPRNYNGGLFLAFRGSSNRAVRVGYSIAFHPLPEGPSHLRVPPTSSRAGCWGPTGPRSGDGRWGCCRRSTGRC